MSSMQNGWPKSTSTIPLATYTYMRLVWKVLSFIGIGLEQILLIIAVVCKLGVNVTGLALLPCDFSHQPEL